MEKARALASQAITTTVFFAAALLVIADGVSAEQGFRQVNVQGDWAYTTRGQGGGTEYMKHGNARLGN
jgi:hypothetical protein